MNYSIYAYPWDLADAAAQTAEEILALGLRGINLAASYHAGKFIQPLNRRRRVCFPEDGVVYFRPRLNYGRIKPVMSQLLEEDDILARLTARRDLCVNAWTVLLHNTRLGLLYPDATVKNAFGDGYIYSLCPAHPDVRRYALTLCKDLAGHYPLKALLLETPGYLAYNHGFHHEFAQVPPYPRLEALLGLCFCEHCLSGAAGAGINSASLRREVAAAIDECLDDPSASRAATPDARPENILSEETELKAFLQWRCGVVASLVEAIRKQVREQDAGVKIKVITTTQATHAASILEGHDLAALRAAADALELPLYQPSPAAVKAEADYILRKLGGTDRHGVILRPGWPDMQGREQLVETLAAVRASGIRNIGFYNYGLLPRASLRWLAEAINRHGAPCVQPLPDPLNMAISG